MGDEEILEQLHGEYGERWWYAKDAVVDLGVSVSDAKHQHMALGRWLAHRRDRPLGNGWRVEGELPPNTIDVTRWRVVPDLI